MKPVAITETARPLGGWTNSDGERLAALEADVDRLLREAAESRFAAREAESRAAADASRRLLGLVQVVDAFDRVFRSMVGKEDRITPQMKVWAGNFRSVRRLVENQLSEEGVVRMQNLAEGFDPRWHRVAETVRDPGRTEGAIVEEVEPGYFWKSQVLRKAQVKVVRNEE